MTTLFGYRFKPSRDVIQGVTLLLMSLAGFQTGNAEQVYKWIDDDGKVHFGDKPPVKENAEQLTIKAAPDVDPDRLGRQQRTERLLEAFSRERREHDEARQADLKHKQERKRNCTIARQDLASYEKSPRLFRYDEHGKVQYIDDEQRLAAIDLVRKAAKRWCD